MSIIDDVKAQLDIIDVISDSVSLKKSGRNYTGFCPFHTNTKTPSFVVFPETQTWRCFGACADGGDLFGFIINREGCDFKEALQILAKRAGISLDHGPQQSKQDEQNKKSLELNAAAATYFHNLLTNSAVGATVRDYLKSRGLTAETIVTFQLGYALDEWDALMGHFIGRGYSKDELQSAGLIIEREDRSSCYDRFRHRLMIPIRDPQGRVIGFGARALAPDQVPKYLNSPQTALFDKSATLYGLDLARKHIREADQVIIVEGYMDVIQAYQRGAKNLVAQMGTALTEQQLKILKRTTNNFVLALDSDAAGTAATLRGINVARETLEGEMTPVPTSRGLIRYEGHLEANIRIAEMPVGKDPDDILKEGLDVWNKIIDRAVPVVDFYFQRIISTLDLETAKGKSKAVRELIPVLRDVSNQVEQKHYIQKLARLIHIDERTLLAELKSKQPAKPLRKRDRSVPTPAVISQIPPETVVTSKRESPDLPSAKLEAYCLSLILANPRSLILANNILEKHNVAGLTLNDLKRGDNREIFKSLQLWTASQTPKFEVLAEIAGKELEPYLTNLLAQRHDKPVVPDENVDQDLSIAILRLRMQNINEQINELTFLQRETQDLATIRHYTEMVEQYKQQRKKLEQIRDALSLSGKRRFEANHFGEVI